ncbi:complement component receptor 1-like protein isoform X2 [Ascaphus truei]|uniref:complement component receptor 1-like protein isoform X2 n=1 Tax=Ascaphus truei TaxID=8439 RepID=UPI003F59E6B3
MFIFCKGEFSIERLTVLEVNTFYERPSQFVLVNKELANSRTGRRLECYIRMNFSNLLTNTSLISVDTVQRESCYIFHSTITFAFYWMQEERVLNCLPSHRRMTAATSNQPGFIMMSPLSHSVTSHSAFVLLYFVALISGTRGRSCGNPGEIENGYFDVPDFLLGSRATYFCNDGFRMSSKRNYRDCQTDGTWSYAVPECEAVICPPPNDITNGTYSPRKDEYSYLDAVTYACNSKNLALVGKSSLFCTKHGNWSSDVPKCTAVECLNPNVTNSKRLSGFQGPYRLNSAISFECVEGFTMSGSSMVTCSISNEWEPPLPECLRVSCGYPGDVENGFIETPDIRFGSTATFACYAGYRLLGDMYRVCMANGQWSNSVPICQRSCPDPPTFPFAEIYELPNLNYFPVGIYILYVCRPGHTLDPFLPPIVVCLESSSWTKATEFCKKVSCGIPENIENGKVEITNTLFNSTATYSCQEGYFLTGAALRQCTADGQWSDSAPTCLPIEITSKPFYPSSPVTRNKEETTILPDIITHNSTSTECDKMWAIQEAVRKCTSTPEVWTKYLQLQYLYLQIENLQLDIEKKKGEAGGSHI